MKIRQKVKDKFQDFGKLKERIDKWTQLHTKIDEKGKKYVDSKELQQFIMQLRCEQLLKK